jgi:hypothetical protein
MKIFKTLMPIVLGLILAILFSCKKEYAECGNSTTAEFTIAESFTTQGNRGILNTYIETDTVLTYDNVKLTAVDSLADSYEWTIGNDSRKQTGRIAYVNFDNPDNIMIKLKVKKKPILECFPNDKGQDSVSHRLVVVDWLQSLVIGKYEGYRESKPSEIFTIEILKDPRNNQFILQNLPNGCSVFPGAYGQPITINYRGFAQDEESRTIYACNYTYGVGVLEGKDKRRMVFPFKVFDIDRKEVIQDKFIGIKK